MRRRIWAGAALLLLGSCGYVGGGLYGARFAYRPEDEPGWLQPLFTTSVGAAALGAVLVGLGLVTRPRRG